MGTAAKGLLKIKWQYQLQFIRCKTKINVTRPRPPHYERALLEQVCIPFFESKKIPQYVPDYEACESSRVKKNISVTDHPLKSILVNETINWFQNSQLIAFFHLNCLSPEEKFQYELLIKKKEMKLLCFSKLILNEALKGTIYEPVISLFDAPTATVLSKEPDVQNLISILKKIPKLVLMGVIVENRLLNVTEFKALGKFKSITEARSELVSILNSASQNLVLQLNHHPVTLVELLKQHKKLMEGDNNSQPKS